MQLVRSLLSAPSAPPTWSGTTRARRHSSRSPAIYGSICVCVFASRHYCGIFFFHVRTSRFPASPASRDEMLHLDPRRTTRYVKVHMDWSILLALFHRSRCHCWLLPFFFDWCMCCVYVCIHKERSGRRCLPSHLPLNSWSCSLSAEHVGVPHMGRSLPWGAGWEENVLQEEKKKNDGGTWVRWNVKMWNGNMLITEIVFWFSM